MGILTGDEIIKAVARGDLVIDPFDEKRVGPNSYDFELGPLLKTYELAPDDNLTRRNTVHTDKGPEQRDHLPYLDPAVDPVVLSLQLPPSGLVLKPGKLYLGHTAEVIGGDRYVGLLGGRSSWGRLGLGVHVTAGFGDLGYCAQWTLELTAVLPLMVRPGDVIGQAWFLDTVGEASKLYRGKYLGAKGPVISAAGEDLRRRVAQERATQAQNHEPPTAEAVVAAVNKGAVTLDQVHAIEDPVLRNAVLEQLGQAPIKVPIPIKGAKPPAAKKKTARKRKPKSKG